MTMSDNPLQSGPIAKFLSWVTPNRTVAWIVGPALLVELTLLAMVPNNIFQEDKLIAWLGPCLLVWFWLTLGWVLWGVTKASRSLLSRCPRVVAWPVGALLIGCAAFAVLVYLGSWALYFRSGRFTNVESILFAVENATNGVLTRYLWQSEQAMLFGVGIFLVALLALLPFMARWVATSKWETVPRGMPRMMLWMTLSILLLGMPYKNIYANPYERTIRKLMWLDLLKNRVNPAITLGSSWVDFITAEPVKPCLDLEDLTPLDQPYRPPEGRKPAIIFVAIESLRPDVVHRVHQGREITPNLNRLAKNGAHLTRAYSQSTHSDYADVCIVSSLYPLRSRHHHYYRSSDPWPRTLIYDVLKPAGYATGIISSQNEAWGGMDQFLQTPNLDFFYDAERSNAGAATHDIRDPGMAWAVKSGELRAGKLVDTHTADVAVEWVKKQIRAKKPYFLSMNLQSSHFPYEMPEDVPRPFQPSTIDFDASFLRYPRDKVEVVRNAYYNAIAHCDRQVGRLIDTLESTGELDNTILVVMGENGEAFHENPDYVTHAREPVEPGLRVACVIHGPQFPKQVVDYPTELIDIVPTVLGRIGWAKHPGFQGMDVLAEDRPDLENRLMFFHTENGLSRADAVISGGRWKLMIDRNRGIASLVDLQNDPTESNNLIEANPAKAQKLTQLLLTWRRQQLAYYHYPAYFSHYYPPAPPRSP